MAQPPFQDDELAMVSAIHVNPRSDAPRLAYAEWLDVRGERDLAEFIRIQCAEPYFTLAKQGVEEATISLYTSWIKFEDPDRAAAAIRLLSRLHPGDRFPDPRLWQEYTRGLPLYEFDVYDTDRIYGVEHLGGRSPLARFRLWLYTRCLAEWLAHPILRRTDHLRLFSVDGENSQRQIPFSSDDIRLLAESDLPDRLDMLGLCSSIPDDAVAIVKNRIETRVEVQFG